MNNLTLVLTSVGIAYLLYLLATHSITQSFIRFAINVRAVRLLFSVCWERAKSGLERWGECKAMAWRDQ